MENPTAKISVIMPAYNAGKYIEKSVNSVLRQSWSNLELIVINDGSKDNTAELLEGMARRDSRLRPATVSNGGPAMARNAGLDMVSPDTEYIMFIDSDDELLPEAAEYALKGSAGADITVFGFSIAGTDGSVRDYTEPEALMDRAAFGESFPGLYKANLLNQVWGKLFRAGLIQKNHIRFQDYRWGEDRLFIFDCLEKAEKIKVLPRCGYRYIMHEGESLITKYYDKKFEVCCEIDRRAEKLCSELGTAEDADFRYMFAKSVISCLTNLFSVSCSMSRA